MVHAVDRVYGPGIKFGGVGELPDNGVHAKFTHESWHTVKRAPSGKEPEGPQLARVFCRFRSIDVGLLCVLSLSDVGFVKKHNALYPTANS